MKIKQSVFIHAVAFSVLCASLTFAQPQAPITWSPIRLLMNAPSSINVSNGVWAHGDTLILTGYSTLGGNELAIVCISGNNGQSFSPWHVFNTPDSIDSWTTFGVTEFGIYCCAPVSQTQRKIFKSTDLGQTWIGSSTALRWLEIKTTRGDTLWCSTWSFTLDSIRYTTDGGNTYSHPIPLDLNQEGTVDRLAVTDSALIVLSRTQLPELPYHTVFRWIAPRTTEQFGTPVRLNPQCLMTFWTDIDIDVSGTGMILSCARY